MFFFRFGMLSAIVSSSILFASFFSCLFPYVLFSSTSWTPIMFMLVCLILFHTLWLCSFLFPLLLFLFLSLVNVIWRSYFASLYQFLNLFLSSEISFQLFYFLKIIFFLYFSCAGSLLLWAFSSVGEWGLFFPCVVQASHCGGFSYCGAWALGCVGFGSCHTWAQ